MGTKELRGSGQFFFVFVVLLTLSMAGCFSDNNGNDSGQGDLDEMAEEMNENTDGIEDDGDEVEHENDTYDVDIQDGVDDSEDGDIDHEFEIPDSIHNEPCLKVRGAMDEECDMTSLDYCEVTFYNRDGKFLSSYYDGGCDGVITYPNYPEYENVYDENGRLIRSMAQRDYDYFVSEFEYDSEGRLILLRNYCDSDYDDQYECAFEYNGSGKLISTCNYDSIEYNDNTGTVTYGCYSMKLDNSGKVVYRESTCTSEYNEQGCRISEYDSENRLVSCTYPERCGNEENRCISGYDTVFTYDESGRLKTVDNDTTGDECTCDEYFYDEFGNPTYINGSCTRCDEMWEMSCYTYENEYLCDGVIPVINVIAECPDFFADYQPFPWMGVYR